MSIQPEHSSQKPLRVVVAGQTPPPVNGQAVFIQALIRGLEQSKFVQVAHWKFFFSSGLDTVRKFNIRKVCAVFPIIAGLFAERFKGPIDLLIFPSGGPHWVPIIRDILLLPFARLLSRRVLLQFHAAGVSDFFAKNQNSLICAILRRLYQSVDAAIVMTPYNRKDPQWAGIQTIYTLPHKIPDRTQGFERSRSLPPNDARIQILCIGSLCEDKGTVELIKALSRLRQQGQRFDLHLLGDCLQPFSLGDFHQLIQSEELEDWVHYHGVQSHEQKYRFFKESDLLVFPTKAPFESFGLVLLEGMMWALPLVVSNWRGNLEVTGTDFDGIAFEVSGPSSSVHALGKALATSMTRIRTDPRWGLRNRKIFLERYDRKDWSDYEEVIQAEGRKSKMRKL